jgi:hypothetical protein
MHGQGGRNISIDYEPAGICCTAPQSVGRFRVGVRFGQSLLM